MTISLIDIPRESNTIHRNLTKGLGDNIVYHVSLLDNSMWDSYSNELHKAPTTKFNNLIQAKIFQLRNFINHIDESIKDDNIINYDCEIVESAFDELKDLIEKYPEYII